MEIKFYIGILTKFDLRIILIDAYNWQPVNYIPLIRIWPLQANGKHQGHLVSPMVHESQKISRKTILEAWLKHHVQFIVDKIHKNFKHGSMKIP